MNRMNHTSALRHLRSLPRFGALLAIMMIAGGAQAAPGDLSVKVVAGKFVAINQDGSRASDHRLTGAILKIGNPNSGGYRVRINAIVADPVGGPRPLTLYDLSFFNQSAGSWEPLCNKGPYGLALAVPVSGKYAADGRFVAYKDGRYSFSCSSGAHLKCLRMGYSPWAKTPNGESLANYHQACTRMMRADYCGTGQSFTVAGRRLQIFDRRSPRPAKKIGTLEAIWGINGAVCLRRPRVPEKFPLSVIRNACPARVNSMVKYCDETLLDSHPQALIGNHS